MVCSVAASACGDRIGVVERTTRLREAPSKFCCHSACWARTAVAGVKSRASDPVRKKRRDNMIRRLLVGKGRLERRGSSLAPSLPILDGRDTINEGYSKPGTSRQQ